LPNRFSAAYITSTDGQKPLEFHYAIIAEDTDNGLYFVPLQEPTSIQFLSFATHQITSVVNFEKLIGVMGRGGGFGGGLTVSPDGRSILFTQFDQAGSELMLVENFH
jgi:hypothetical protein